MFEYIIVDPKSATEYMDRITENINIGMLYLKDQKGYRSLLNDTYLDLSLGSHTPRYDKNGMPIEVNNELMARESVHDIALYVLMKINENLPENSRFANFSIYDKSDNGLPQSFKKLSQQSIEDLNEIAKELIQNKKPRFKPSIAKDLRLMFEEYAKKKGIEVDSKDNYTNIAFKMIKELNAKGIADNYQVKRAYIHLMSERNLKANYKKNEYTNFVESTLKDLVNKIDDPSVEEEIKGIFEQFSRTYNYSYYNNLMIAMEARRRGETVTMVQSFQKWKSMKNDKGQSVSIKKGARGYKILVPVEYTIYKRDENGEYILDDKGKRIPEVDKNGKIVKGLGFKIGTVFDISQTNAIEIGAIRTLPYRDRISHIERDFLEFVATKVIHEYGVNVIFKKSDDMMTKGYYIPKSKTIYINDNPHLKDSEKLSTLFHELGHHIMHGDVLRSGKIDYGAIHRERGKREGEAESFAYAMSRQYGLQPRSELYIRSWGNDKENLEDLLKNVMAAVKDASKKVGYEVVIREYSEKIAKETRENFKKDLNEKRNKETEKNELRHRNKNVRRMR